MKPRLAVALTFPVFPPLGGGQVRVLHLYRELGRVFDVELVSLAPNGAPGGTFQLAEGLRERRVAKSEAHVTAETKLEERARVVVTDVAMGRLHELTPDYAEALRRAGDGACGVVASHPYAYAAVREAGVAPLCYEAHNVEATLKADLLGATAAGRELLAEVDETERRCCEEAALIWTCSEQDRDELSRRYGVAADSITVTPNGVALEELPFTDAPTRAARRHRLRLQARPTAIFLASWHWPNVLAARRLVATARRRPETDFLVLGSVGAALADEQLPDNLSCAGVVAAEHKRDVLGVADVALNPVTTGSGTNIKMLDYFASGIPVISSAFGARGLGVQPGRHYVAAEPAAHADALAELAGWDAGRVSDMVEAAREHVARTLSWEAIATQLAHELTAALGVDAVPASSI